MVWAFVDEAKADSNCPWHYIGVTLVRQDDIPSVADRLAELRLPYSGELHFRKIRQASKRDAAIRWIRFAIDDLRIKFSAAGVKERDLHAAVFGASGAELRRRIHLRFLHPIIALAVKRPFGSGAQIGGSSMTTRMNSRVTSTFQP